MSKQQYQYDWWNGDEGEVHTQVMEYVAAVENAQADTYDRYVKLASLYDPNSRESEADSYGYSGGGSRSFGSFRSGSTMSQNVIASNVDTVVAAVAATEVRVRFMTDDGDWSDQRRAKHLEWYSEALGKSLNMDEAARLGFKDCALKGTGIVKVFPDYDQKKVCVERVLPDDIIVDDGECRAGNPPRQVHYRRFVDRESLKMQFPEKAEEIEAAHRSEMASTHPAWRYWADYRPLERDETVVVESHRLPIGVPGSDHYKPGRHTICISGCDLYDEEWEKPFFPYAVIKWSDRDKGWHGIGLGERIAGHQRLLNKLNWQIDRQLDQLAVPTTYVRAADAKLAVKATNRLGTIATYKADLPKTILPQAVSGETYKRAEDVLSSAYEESGVSRLAASSMKPAGLESGAALREYRDQTTQRFSIQEKNFEKFRMDILWLALDACKDLGPDAPVMRRKSRFGAKRIKWSQVDMGDVGISMAAASNISRTPAGRTQTVLEYAQTGVISQDEARRLLQHPDLERAMSLFNAALEDIERCIEEILDGGELVPEPYQNLKLGVYRFQMAYLKAIADGAPERILDKLQQWLVQAAWIQGKAQEAELQAQAQAAAPQFQDAPAQAVPQSALAPEAIGVAPA